MKKEYETPKMEIVEMAYCNKLLSGSDNIDVEPDMCGDDPCEDGY